MKKNPYKPRPGDSHRYHGLFNAVDATVKAWWLVLIKAGWVAGELAEMAEQTKDKMLSLALKKLSGDLRALEAEAKEKGLL